MEKISEDFVEGVAVVLEIMVYGAKERCASCVNAPSSLETASWLEAALSRVYDQHLVTVRYVDIFDPQLNGRRSLLSAW